MGSGLTGGPGGLRTVYRAERFGAVVLAAGRVGAGFGGGVQPA
jgi:hypothetical protein